MPTYNKQHQQRNMSIIAKMTPYNKNKNSRKPGVKTDTITDKKSLTNMFVFMILYHMNYW